MAETRAARAAEAAVSGPDVLATKLHLPRPRRVTVPPPWHERQMLAESPTEPERVMATPLH